MVKTEKILKPIKAEIYQSIHKLPLAIFIDIVVDNDYSGLVISGTPEPGELEDAWINIHEQYCEAIGNGSATNYLEREVLKLSITLFVGSEAISLLRKYYVPAIAQKLSNAIAFFEKLDPTKPDEYDKILNRYETRLRSVKMRLAIAQTNLDAIQAKEKGKTIHVDRQYFTRVLVALSDIAGYEIDESKITVAKFCERIKRAQAASEKQQTNPKK